MRGLLTIILFIIFFFSFSIAVYTYSINSILKPDYVKNLLSESKIYSVVADGIPDLIISSENGDDKLIPAETKAQLGGFIKQVVTAEYLQNKIEPFVDDTFSWLSGKTETVPSLSFQDLGKQLEPLGVVPLLSDEVSDIVSKPIEIKEGDYQLRSSFQFSQMAPIIFSALAAIVLFVIFLMAKGWRSKLRKTSLAILLPSILGLAGVATTLLVGNMLVGVITDNLSGSEFEQFGKPLNDILVQIPLDISVRMGAIYGVALAASVIFFGVSFFVSRKKEATQAQEQTSATLPTE